MWNTQREGRSEKSGKKKRRGKANLGGIYRIVDNALWFSDNVTLNTTVDVGAILTLPKRIPVVDTEAIWILELVVESTKIAWLNS